jgi:hypothetical protein
MHDPRLEVLLVEGTSRSDTGQKGQAITSASSNNRHQCHSRPHDIPVL